MRNALITSSVGLTVTYLLLIGAICVGSGEPMQATIDMTKGYVLGCTAWYGGLGIVWSIRQARRLSTFKKVKNKP